MKNFRIIVQYEGSRYRGWQVLKDTEQTVQGKLQQVLGVLAGQPVEVIGSGRTDAGVHALGQCANFHLDETVAERGLLQQNNLSGGSFTQRLQNYLNYYLPDDIAVISLTETAERFHARYHAKAKTYRYRIYTSFVPDVFNRRYVYTYTDLPLDEDAMRRAAEQLCGSHDFASFCANKKMKKSTVRRLDSIVIRREGPELILEYTGDGFLQGMVRILTGTLIEVGSGRRDPNSVTELLQAKNRSLAGYTVPACGLTLVKVFYD